MPLMDDMVCVCVTNKQYIGKQIHGNLLQVCIIHCTPLSADIGKKLTWKMNDGVISSVYQCPYKAWQRVWRFKNLQEPTESISDFNISTTWPMIGRISRPVELVYYHWHMLHNYINCEIPPQGFFILGFSIHWDFGYYCFTYLIQVQQVAISWLALFVAIPWHALLDPKPVKDKLAQQLHIM